MHGMTRRPLTALAVFLLALLVGSGEARSQTFERWYSLLLSDQPAGWSWTRQTQEGDRITSASNTRFSIRRGPIVVEIEIGTEFIETTDGKPVEATVTQKLAAMRMVQRMVFGDGEVEIISEQAGQKQSQKHKLAADGWLTPAAVERYTEQQMAAGAKTIEFRTLDPSSGPRPYKVTLQFQSEGSTEVMGKVVPAQLWHASMSQMPGIVARTYTDAKGRPLRTTVTPMPGFEFTMIESDEMLAKAQINPPELLVSTLIRPDRPLNDPRNLRKATYRVTLKAMEAGGADIQQASFPTGATQRAERLDDGSYRVTVDLDRLVDGAADKPGEAELGASSMLNHEDKVIREMAATALKGVENQSAAQKAEVLRQYVHRFIDAKDLSVGYATASEVARTGQGDCTEHAVLLAALLRAAGIPSRTVTGLVYVDQFLDQSGIFGYHMWARAWDGKRWIDLDATLDENTPFDAAHIALATSSLVDGDMVNDMMATAPLIGRLAISVTSQGK